MFFCQKKKKYITTSFFGIFFFFFFKLCSGKALHAKRWEMDIYMWVCLVKLGILGKLGNWEEQVVSVVKTSRVSCLTHLCLFSSLLRLTESTTTVILSLQTPCFFLTSQYKHSKAINLEHIILYAFTKPNIWRKPCYPID